MLAPFTYRVKVATYFTTGIESDLWHGSARNFGFIDRRDYRRSRAKPILPQLEFSPHAGEWFGQAMPGACMVRPGSGRAMAEPHRVTRRRDERKENRDQRLAVPAGSNLSYAKDARCFGTAKLTPSEAVVRLRTTGLTPQSVTENSLDRAPEQTSGQSSLISAASLDDHAGTSRDSGGCIYHLSPRRIGKAWREKP